MQPRSKALLTTTCLGLLVLALGLFTAKKIDLLTADLGRHLANGRWLPLDATVLSTNFYAHDFAMTPFVNHHWLSGLIFLAIESVAGFPGLSLAYLALTCAAYALMARLAVRQGGATVGLGLAVLMLPLVAFRTEVRPEGFSYFLASVFLWFLVNYRSGRHGAKALRWVLPVLTVLWVNLHIYFIFGLGMIFCFCAEAGVRQYLGKGAGVQPQGAARTLGLTLSLSLTCALINPFGWRLALYPLHIFDNYGYLIVENQSVWFLEKLGMAFPVFGPLYTATALFWLALLVRPWRSLGPLPWAAAGVAALFSAMALLGIRNISLFGLLAMPALAEILRSQPRWLRLALGPIAIAALALFTVRIWEQLPYRFGLGLVDPDNGSATFFKVNGIKGPIFNNYDIGGYLIYHLYPRVPPFVDNRPEAYPPGFLQDVYVPMQEKEDRWREQDAKYQFNAIFFYWHDMTPAAQTFLIARVQDPDWVPVYVDGGALILLRNNELNQGLIARFAIPRENFRQR